MDADASPRAQTGFTLIELLVTISIIGIAFVALFTGLSTFLAVSAEQRANANNDAAVRQYIEQVTSPQTKYALCSPSTPNNYSTVTLPTGFIFSSGPTITYWTGTKAATFSGTCNTNGVEQITATIRQTISAGRTHDTPVTFTKRNTCAPPNTIPDPGC